MTTYDTEDFFPSNFFRATEYLSNEGAEMTATINSLKREEVGKNKDKKPVLHFANNRPKPLILNRTNWNTLRDRFGPPANWNGNQIILYSKMVEFGGETTLGTRIRIPKNSAPGKQANKPPVAPADEPPPYEDIPDFILPDAANS